MKNKPKVWLARNSVTHDWRIGCYVVSHNVKLRYDKEGQYWYAFRGGEKIHKTIRPFDFERIAPPECHLEPGEGPIEISVTIKKIGRKKR